MTYWFVTEEYDVQITNMFDVDGDVTENPDDAFKIVGQLPDGRWLASEVRYGDIVRRDQ